MNHSKTEFLQIRVFIYFLMISVGMEFVRGLTWWFWLRVFHEIQLDVNRGCRHLRAWLRLEGFLAKQLTWLQAGAGYCQFSPNPLLNFPAGLLEGPLLWKQESPRLNDPRNQGRNCNISYALDSEVVHLCFHWIFTITHAGPIQWRRLQKELNTRWGLLQTILEAGQCSSCIPCAYNSAWHVKGAQQMFSNNK